MAGRYTNKIKDNKRRKPAISYASKKSVLLGNLLKKVLIPKSIAHNTRSANSPVGKYELELAENHAPVLAPGMPVLCYLLRSEVEPSGAANHRW